MRAEGAWEVIKGKGYLGGLYRSECLCRGSAGSGWWTSLSISSYREDVLSLLINKLKDKRVRKMEDPSHSWYGRVGEGEPLSASKPGSLLRHFDWRSHLWLGWCEELWRALLWYCSHQQHVHYQPQWVWNMVDILTLTQMRTNIQAVFSWVYRQVSSKKREIVSLGLLNLWYCRYISNNFGLPYFKGNLISPNIVATRSLILGHYSSGCFKWPNYCHKNGVDLWHSMHFCLISFMCSFIFPMLMNE